MTDSNSAFAQRALALLPRAALGAPLSAALLGGFDAFQARRARSLAELIWPGAPRWATGAALAGALAAGLAAGVLFPVPMPVRAGFSLDAPPVFSVDAQEDL